MADVKEIIKDLGNTDWGNDDESQMKAVQLLKGLALSKEPISNMFMKKLSDASTAIAKTVLDNKPDEKNESLLIKTNAILEGLEEMGIPKKKETNVSSTINRANSLL